MPSWRTVLAIAVLLLLVLLGGYLAHQSSPKHLQTVREGVLYRSAALPPDQLDEVVERYGIRTVVNLRSELENRKGDWHGVEAELLARRGVRLIDLPMNTGYPPDERTLEGWLRVLDSPSSQPILVHCEYGVVRTGMMVAVFEMEYGGRTNEQAWRDFVAFGGAPDEPVLGRVRDFVLGYRLHEALLRPPELPE